MLLSTTENIGEEYEVLGFVQGASMRAVHLGRDLAAALKKLVGGEVGTYTRMISEARDEALRKIIAEAEKMGADAIVSLRFSTTAVMSGAAEILVYGTAVRLKKTA